MGSDISDNLFISSLGADILPLAESPEAFYPTNNVTYHLLSLLSLTQGCLKGSLSFPSSLYSLRIDFSSFAIFMSQ